MGRGRRLSAYVVTRAERQSQMAPAPDITVIIATRNREKSLSRTLTALASADRTGITVEVVVVDNGSVDSTADVVRGFSGIRINYLHEATPGKSSALNHALDTCTLGHLVAFTDDDTQPRADWLQAIKAVSGRWPNVSAFGGEIYVLWPQGYKVPVWAHDPGVANACYGQLSGDGERLCGTSMGFPCGANMWFRNCVFQNGRRFDTRFGQMPGRCLLGDESQLLQQLVREGLPIMFSPSAVVGHYVGPKALQWKSAAERMMKSGRTSLHMDGRVNREALLRKSPLLWFSYRCIAVGASIGKLGLSGLGVLKRSSGLHALRRLGRDIEMIRVANQRRRQVQE